MLSDPQDPITGGGAAAVIGNIGHWVMGLADVPARDQERFYKTTRSLSSSRPKSPVAQATPLERLVAAQSRLSVQSAGSSRQSIAHFNEPKTSSVVGESERGGIDRPSSETASHLHSSSSHEGLRSHRGSTSEGHRRSTTCQSVRNADNDSTSSPDQVCLDTVVNASRTAAKLFNMSLKAPMNLTLAIAKRFHNAPLLYGDNTVREAHRITGIKSGFKAAGKAGVPCVVTTAYLLLTLLLGVWGMVSTTVFPGWQHSPWLERERMVLQELLRDLGRELEDWSSSQLQVSIKPHEMVIYSFLKGRLLGVWGLTGYTVNGIYKQLRKWFGENVENYIIASRCAQGAEECSRSTAEERADILRQ